MKKIFLLAVSLFASVLLWAQNVGIGTSLPLARLHVTDSNVLFSGGTVISDPGTVGLPINGAGTRLMWIPQKSAFRVGTVFSTQWDADSIGAWSFATGKDTRAKGILSTAMGELTIASGEVSTAFGLLTTASGARSTALGYNNKATGSGALVGGNLSLASGDYSVAIGTFDTASGYSSAAFGGIARASGSYSVAMGYATEASGNRSFAIGDATKAAAWYSTAMGFANNSGSFASLAMGRYNDSVAGASKTTWVPEDPTFYIGNGSSYANPHNTMVVYKNGNMVLKTPSRITIDPPLFTVPVRGEGTRLMWLPEKNAFRVGSVWNTNWDAANIGFHSVAIGHNPLASGGYSFAMGSHANATGVLAFAIGDNVTAGNQGTISIGSLVSSQGLNSTAIGFRSVANGDYSIAIGDSAVAAGSSSFAFGARSIAAEAYSISAGFRAKATGYISTSIGESTNSRAAGSFAIGRYNDSIATSDPGLWVSTDPLFYIGNGASNTSRHNAMVVYKNGNTDHNGYTRLGESSNGSPRIKIKKLTGVSSASQNTWVNIPHGLSQAKILGVSIVMEVPGFVNLPPSYRFNPGYEYEYQISSTNIVVINSATNSGNILSKNFAILITYEE